MKMPISPRVHGAIDYSTIAATAAAPRVLGFSERAARAAYGLAGGYLALSALTDYSPSLKRLVPLKAHATTDMVLGAALPALPWALGFAKDRRARNFYFSLTAFGLLATALTDWSGRERE